MLDSTAARGSIPNLFFPENLNPNPLRYHTFNPGHAMLFGEDDYFTNLKTVFPNHILLVDVDSSILGHRYFGRDYARPIYSWIAQNYKVQKQFGAVPFSGL